MFGHFRERLSIKSKQTTEQQLEWSFKDNKKKHPAQQGMKEAMYSKAS